MTKRMKHRMRRAVTWWSTRNRQRKIRAIGRFIDQVGAQSLLMCGTGRIGGLPNEAMVEHALASKMNTVMAMDIRAVGPQPWPFTLADARSMPFADQSYDLVLANAVIEHVGGEEDQRRFVAEQTRVGRSWVITTPNRWFPVESHTAVVFKHWSGRWRSDRADFTRLLSRREFIDLLPEGAVVVGHPWSSTFTAYYEGLGTGDSAS